MVLARAQRCDAVLIKRQPGCNDQGNPKPDLLGKHAADHLRVLADGRPPLTESEGRGNGLVLAQISCLVFQ